MLEEERLQKEKEAKKENLSGKMKRQEVVTREESEGSNKKTTREKLKDEPAKVPEPEEDPSTPETHSEKIYKVKSHYFTTLGECQLFIYSQD